MNDAPSTLRLSLLALHVLSLLFWIGSLVSVTRVLSAAEGEPDAVRAKLAHTARRIYAAVSSVWMGLAVLTGLYLVATYPAPWQAQRAGITGVRWLFQQGFWHAKLTGVIALLALHFALGSRVRRAERETASSESLRPMRRIQLGVLLVAAAIVAAVIVHKRARVPACPPARAARPPATIAL